MNDPLYLVSIQICCTVYAASQMNLTLRRQSRAGQSLLQVCAAASAFRSWRLGSILFLGPATHDWRSVGMNIVIFGWYCVDIFIFYKQPKDLLEPATGMYRGVGQVATAWPEVATTA